MKKISILFSGLFSFFLQAQSGFGDKNIINSGVNSSWTIATDLNNDGFQDVITASIGTSTISWYQNIEGLGNFSSQNIITNNLSGTHRVNFSDIDNDGDMDVLALAFGVDLVVWYENLDGNGTFSSQKIITTSQDLPNTIIGADIDGDGDLDVVVCSRLDNTIAWYENLGGQGTWGSQQTISTTALNAFSVVAKDIDGDGDLDIISDTSTNSNNPSWYRNMNGEGTFGGAHILTSENSGTISVKTADIDNDGDQDIITLEFGGINLTEYYRNFIKQHIVYQGD